jgi:peroxiredoxin
LTLVALLGAGCAPTLPRAVGSAATAPAHALPRVELVALDGAVVPLDAALAGRPTVVSLWATWCEACATEFAALERLHQRAAERGGAVLAVAVGEPRQRVAEFVRANHLGYPQLVDEQFALADALGQKRVPATLVVDRHGRVVFSGGALDAPAIAALSAAMDATTSR